MTVLAALDIEWVIVTVLGAGGFITAGVTALRYRKQGGADRDSVVVTAAQGALVVQSGVLDELQQELERCRTSRDNSEAASRAVTERMEQLENGELKQLRDEVYSLCKQIEEVTGERDQLRREKAELIQRVDDLEDEVRELKRTNGS